MTVSLVRRGDGGAFSFAEAELLDVEGLALLAAPIVCLAGCLAGIKLVFPLNELASVRSLTDIGIFLGASLAVVWLFSQFRGWGIIFFGGLEQMVIIGALGFYLLRRLYKRALGGRS